MAIVHVVPGMNEKNMSFDFNTVLPIKILDSFNVHQRLTLHVHVNHVTGCCAIKDNTVLPSKWEVLYGVDFTMITVTLSDLLTSCRTSS